MTEGILKNDDVASSEEVRQAIADLTEAQLIRLEGYARFRVRSLGDRALGRTHEDLLRDALAATLAGERLWKFRKVDFFSHLISVMRSRSSHWNERGRSVLFLPESETREPLAPTPAPDEILQAKEELQRIEKYFSNDEGVLDLIRGMGEGLRGPEMQLAYGLTRSEYESALKRLRRGLEKIFRGEEREME